MLSKPFIREADSGRKQTIELGGLQNNVPEPTHRSGSERAVDRVHGAGYDAGLRCGQPSADACKLFETAMTLESNETVHQLFHLPVIGNAA